ncbi:MAG: MBL fold metallo-hydrolase [Thermoplasmatales archaeon]|nr:MBL fold metallo-hydrolase [Thermoplasmatales archaeon]
MIRFLGTWSSHLSAGKRNSSILLDEKILFDCGPHTVESLFDNKVPLANIETVLISHMHLDHYAGLAELLWLRAINKIRDQMVVIGPEGIEKSTNEILRLVNTPDSFDVSVKFVENKDYDGILLARANHIIPDNSYRVESGGKSLVYTGDTTYSTSVAELAERSDYLLHECTYPDHMADVAARWKHSTVSDAIRVRAESRSRTLIPIHLTQESLEQLTSMREREMIRIPFEGSTLDF